MYKLYDTQREGYYPLGNEPHIFNTLEGIRQYLADFHSIDWTSVDDNGEPLDINTLTLDQLLDYGEWEVHTLSGRIFMA